jgi:hypothetical protein
MNKSTASKPIRQTYSQILTGKQQSSIEMALQQIMQRLNKLEANITNVKLLTHYGMECEWIAAT